jgi:hypothetical protein
MEVVENVAHLGWYVCGWMREVAPAHSSRQMPRDEWVTRSNPFLFLTRLHDEETG